MLHFLQGWYIYLEASSSRRNIKRGGDVARLVSKPIKVARLCFRMYYHMFGGDMGELRVGVKFENKTQTILWTESGDQGKPLADTLHSTLLNALSKRHYENDMNIL